ncbi:MAG: zinc metallopeptidase [Verrucomicrobia bacterium]|nr:zinc metallopeptidase [Verrucomicrobiota bacterium]MCH8514404.1 zinc metallopeptidase [Kiritimatiellia bacterium]
MFIDPYFLLFAAPALALSLYASHLTKTRFQKYSKVMASSGLTGAQAAYQMMRREGVTDVGIEKVAGFLSDHYDPRKKVLRLSPAVHDGRSLSALGVACHEAGHALQHNQGYAPLALRSSLVPAASFSSQLAGPILMIGLVLSILAGPIGQPVMLAGIVMLSLAVLFTLITLPVEWDASARAKRVLVNDGIVTEREQADAGAVLDAAFLTYLAAAVASIMTLLYWLWRSGLIGGRR